MSRSVLYCWHRRIGLAVFVAIIAWAVSGLSHPIMSRLNPRPVAMHPPASTAFIASLLPLATTLSAQGINDFQQAQLLNIDDTSYYRIEHDDNTTYINARSGQRAVLNDEAYAQKLARHYLGDDTNKIASVELITAFNEDYLFINRFLPVYKVTFERADNMRAYVEISTGRLATLVDDRKALVGWIFRQLHSWVFIDNPWLRTIAMSGVLLAGMALSLAGLWMAWCGRSKIRIGNDFSKPGSSRQGSASVWHRRLGIGFGLLMLTFSFSGLYHLLQKPVIAPPALLAPLPSFHAQGLTLDWQAAANASGAEYFRRGSLVKVDGQPYLRLALAAADKGMTEKSKVQEHHSSKPGSQGGGLIYINAQSSLPCVNCERQHALNLAAHYAGSLNLSPSAGHINKQAEKITRFSSDYGFINKRMPVYAVGINEDPAAEGNSQMTLFVETATGALAGHSSPSSKWEGWSFSYLHKWHFFDPFSKDLRDILLIVSTLIIALLCLLGAWISFKPRS